MTLPIDRSVGTAMRAVILHAAATDGDGAHAFRAAFWWAVGFTALAVPLSLLLPGRPTSDDAETAGPGPRHGERVPR